MNWSAWSAPRNELICNKDFHTNSLPVLCVSIVQVWQSGKTLGSPERRADLYLNIMSTIRYGYPSGTRFLLLVHHDDVAGIVDDWFEGNFCCDLRLRRAKTKGCIVVETTDALYASRIYRYHPGIRVEIITPK